MVTKWPSIRSFVQLNTNDYFDARSTLRVSVIEMPIAYQKAIMGTPCEYGLRITTKDHGVELVGGYKTKREAKFALVRLIRMKVKAERIEQKEKVNSTKIRIEEAASEVTSN